MKEHYEIKWKFVIVGACITFAGLFLILGGQGIIGLLSELIGAGFIVYALEGDRL